MIATREIQKHRQTTHWLLQNVGNERADNVFVHSRAVIFRFTSDTSFSRIILESHNILVLFFWLLKSQFRHHEHCTSHGQLARFGNVKIFTCSVTVWRTTLRICFIAFYRKLYLYIINFYYRAADHFFFFTIHLVDYTYLSISFYHKHGLTGPLANEHRSVIKWENNSVGAFTLTRFWIRACNKIPNMFGSSQITTVNFAHRFIMSFFNFLKENLQTTYWYICYHLP